jgi:hypothetical protein
MKQQQRRQQWQRLKVELLKADHNLVCSDTSSDSQPNQWDEKTCEVTNCGELSGFLHDVSVVGVLTASQ